MVPLCGPVERRGQLERRGRTHPDADAQGNRIDGKGTRTGNARNTYIHAPGRTVVALGTQDLLIIDTPDALLVAQRDHAEQVKDVVPHLEQRAATAGHPAPPRCPGHWGWYDSIDMGERFQVKRIGVKPGASLSLQKHHHRAEHWIVVQRHGRGDARARGVSCSPRNSPPTSPLAKCTRLHNPGKSRSGNDRSAIRQVYLGEDDIVRLEDTYGRTSS